MEIACLVDGEHYIPNIKDTLDKLSKEHTIKVAIFIGGAEKIGSKEEVKEKLGYHVEFAEEKARPAPEKIGEIAKKHNVKVVFDYSDEPIVNYDVRMQIACELLGKGITYRGADFEFTPMEFKEILTKPSIAIWGTGKRVGKTAIGGYIVRTLKEAGYKPGVVTLSRGGPNTPEVLCGDLIDITPEYLLEMQEKGFHAASDNFEDALTGKTITFGCKRCGGGFAGKPSETIVEMGAIMANEHPEVDTIILEGSGATFPEIKTNKVVLLVGAGQPLHHITGFFGPYRIKFADLVIVAFCEEPIASKEKINNIVKGIKKINPNTKIATTIFRPKPLKDITGKKVLFATTAPNMVLNKLIKYLEENYNCKVVGSTPYLSDRSKLKMDINNYIKEAEVVLTELKAASVAVVTKEAIKKGLEVVFCDNEPILIRGNVDVKDLKRAIVELRH
ncbi:MAG TPA: 2,3-diphosphoglycerate synthetase [Methanosarcinales archaeon]|nr:2,3-diphosphoglycerate synthetase [Methanosarcinales archaeon]